MTLIKYCGGEGKRVRIEEIMERIHKEDERGEEELDTRSKETETNNF